MAFAKQTFRNSRRQIGAIFTHITRYNSTIAINSKLAAFTLVAFLDL
jgi:hypothetical protein